jgi:hypothetical protein
VNLDSCTNASNAFGFGYTTTATTPGYMMFRVSKNFLNEPKALEAYADCIDGNWIDVAACFNIMQQRRKNGQDTFGNLINAPRYAYSDGKYSNFISENNEFTINKMVDYKDLNGFDATEFRIAQYYNPGNILGFFAETNESSYGKNIYAVGYSRVDYKIPFMLTKKYIRALNNGHHLWYFYVPFNNETNKDALIEY